MADADNTQTLVTEFQTWHNSNGDLHLRTHSQILFVSKKDEELVERAKKLPRGSKIKVSGSMQYSNTLSTHVLHVTELESA